MAYINSSNIIVFPATKRDASYQRQSRQMSEENLVGIINKLIDTNAFVISYEGNTIEFNIHGYYFKVSGINDIISSFSNNVYATITLSTNGDYVEIANGDEDNQYKGLTLTDSEQTGENVHCLKILQKINNMWGIPDESKIKFNINSINFDFGKMD